MLFARDPNECTAAGVNARLVLEGRPTGESAPRPVRIAVLSFLFNWPSTGGGNIHTAAIVDFLGRRGYDVRQFLA